MKQIAIKMDFETSTIHWYDKSMSFHTPDYFNNKPLLRKVLSNEPFSVAEAYIAQNESSIVDGAEKYRETDISELCNQQDHLSLVQRNKLNEILSNHQQLFKGLENRQLGIFPTWDYHIDLMLRAKAFHIKQLYSIALHMREALTKEILHQIQLGILERTYAVGILF